MSYTSENAAANGSTGLESSAADAPSQANSSTAERPPEPTRSTRYNRQVKEQQGWLVRIVFILSCCTVALAAWAVLQSQRLDELQAEFQLLKNSTHEDVVAKFSRSVGTAAESEKACPCKEGPEGPPGRTGQPGTPGRPGKPGTPGTPGHTGVPGVRGDEGRPGEPGRVGRSGHPGVAGRPGQPGSHGKPGKPGVNGKPGLPGLDGKPGKSYPELLGVKGEPGSPGLLGIPGPPGPPGQPGSSATSTEASVGSRGQGVVVIHPPQSLYADHRDDDEVITRWGHDESCGGLQNSEMLYQGFAAAIESTTNSDFFGVHSLECVPHTTVSTKASGDIRTGPVLSAVKINIQEGVRPLINTDQWNAIDQQRLPCIVCKYADVGRKFEVFGSSDCGRKGYTKVMVGYTMAPMKRGRLLIASKPICVTDRPSLSQRVNVTNPNAAELGFVRSSVEVGTRQDQLLPCVICVKSTIGSNKGAKEPYA